MTELLKEAFWRAAQLSEEQQDAVASLILAELESERKWDEAFVGSQAPLAQLAAEAIADDDAGLARPLLPDDEA